MDQTRSTLLVRIRDPADTKAWGEFVALYQPLLTAYVRQRGLGEEDVRDVVQDVFARLVKSRQRQLLAYPGPDPAVLRRAPGGSGRCPRTIARRFMSCCP
ncbi:MAG: RNA polymerase sigma factor [Isosphaerales bacterium]